jgi:hypothetical protein
MESIYYDRYDVEVSLETGEFLGPLCSCQPEDNCSYKEAWVEDGSPKKLSEEVLVELRK